METENLIGKVTSLEALIGYQKGAVVSRTVIDKPSGTVTLFAFDAGQGLSEHTAPYDALVQVLDGEVTITLAGKPHTVKKGDMLIMPANVPHGLKAVTPFKMLLVMIKF